MQTAAISRTCVGFSFIGYVAAGSQFENIGTMKKKFENAGVALLSLLVVIQLTPAPVFGQYMSPYGLRFDQSTEELLAPNREPPRNDWHLESKIPYQEWYSRRVRKEFGAWGPSPRHYPAIVGYESRSNDWKRARVLCVAASYIGLPYQHHHIPDWNPPESWPWKEVAYGHNSKGVDCSDFTSWVYNYGLGIKLKTGIREQAETAVVTGPGGSEQMQVERINDEKGYDDLIARLKTGDLLFIRNQKGVVGHVIMWVGSHGRSPDQTPLVIDCTGPEHKDCNGNPIPIGVQLRPFRRNEWYYRSFDHANRIIRGEG